MRAVLTAVIVPLVCAAGFAAALLSFPAAASAWSPSSLPPGWTIEHDTGGLDPNCQDAYRIWTKTGAFSNLFCTASPTYQADFDGWVDAHYTAPPTSTTTATTAATTSPDTTTTTTTDTTATTTAPADPPPTQTVTAAAATTVTVADPTIEARVTALETNYAALAARVDAIANANTAAWDAFIAATGAGASAADAALAARSAGLNAIYQLG